jgi:hypothetical protein
MAATSVLLFEAPPTNDSSSTCPASVQLTLWLQDIKRSVSKVEAKWLAREVKATFGSIENVLQVDKFCVHRSRSSVETYPLPR